MRLEEFEDAAEVLRELGLNSRETLDVMGGVVKDLDLIKRLWKTGDESKLIKMGLALITFPEPTPLSETLGALVLSIGLVQKKRKQSTLDVDEVYNTFQEILRGMHHTNKKMTS